jgi:S1-C subfamily serine protease
VRRARTLLAGVLLTGASVVVLLDVEAPDVSSAPAPTTTLAPVEVGAAVEIRPVPVVHVDATTCDGRSRGSGVLLDGGRVLTARHVVAGATEVEVEIDGLAVPARVVALDGAGRDAALLDVPALATRQGAPVDEDGTTFRTPVTVWGHPRGRALADRTGLLLGDLEEGPLSLDGGRVLTIDAFVEEGMSGGPVVDATGTVVGVAIGYESNTRTGIAVPSDELGRLLDGVGLTPGRAAAR